MKPVNVDELLIAADRALERRQLLMEHRHYQALLEGRVQQATRGWPPPIASWSTPTAHAGGARLRPRHPRRRHRITLAPRPRLCAGHRARVRVPEPELPDLAHGVLLHDIGKIGIPDAILLKPGPLTEEEWKIMRRIRRSASADRKHPVPARRGPHRLLAPREVGRQRVPAGAAGRRDSGRRAHLLVVDAFDAMTFDRPYSKAIPSTPPRPSSSAARAPTSTRRSSRPS